MYLKSKFSVILKIKIGGSISNAQLQIALSFFFRRNVFEFVTRIM
jgi:hypothetical protein